MVTTYDDAFEPNDLFDVQLEEGLQLKESPLPCLVRPSTTLRFPFGVEEDGDNCENGDAMDQKEKYDLLLFCPSIYGMKTKHKFIEKHYECLSSDRRAG
jgi:hypothetical protein